MRFDIATIPGPDEVRNQVAFFYDVTRDYDATVTAVQSWLDRVRETECTPRDGMDLSEAHKRACSWPLIVGDAMLALMGI